VKSVGTAGWLRELKRGDKLTVKGGRRSSCKKLRLNVGASSYGREGSTMASRQGFKRAVCENNEKRSGQAGKTTTTKTREEPYQLKGS